MKKLFLILFLLIGINAFSQEVTLMYSDTVTTAVDTLSRHISTTSNAVTDLVVSRYSFSVVADDTLQFSTTATFTESFILLPNESYNSTNWNAYFISNLYFKRYGTAGVVTYRLILTGNK